MSLSARLTFLGSLLVALFFGSFLLGRYPVPPQDVVSLLLESLGGSSAAVDDSEAIRTRDEHSDNRKQLRHSLQRTAWF